MASINDAPDEHVLHEGARIAYRRAGSGPTVVLVKNNRYPKDFGVVERLVDRFRVIQVHPVGFGASDRPPDYSFGSIDTQVLAVMDREQVDQFVVWGFSQTAAMAAMVARSTPRAVALIAGGMELIGEPTAATMRRLEREPRLPAASLGFWRAYRQIDWHRELKTMTKPKLMYIGTSDPGWPRMRRAEPMLHGCGCDYLQFGDLDHTTAGLSASTEGSHITVTAITNWLEAALPDAW